MSLRDKWLNMTGNLSAASPKIKIVVGVVGLIGAGVYACIKSAKVKKETEEERKIFDDIHRVRQSQKNELPEEEKIPEDLTACYSEKDYAKDVIRASFLFAKKLVKVYWLPLTVAVVSTCLIFNGMNVLNNRNLALSAAYASVSSAYEAYRARVKERFGEDVENEIYYATEHKEAVDGSTGEKVDNASVAKIGEKYLSPYMILFDENCDEWVSDIGYCEHTLRGIQAILQDRLDKKKPYVTYGELLYEIGKNLDENDEYDQLIAMNCGWRHGDKIDLRVKKIFIPNKDNSKVYPYFMLDPNVRDVHHELVSEYNGNETSGTV